MTLQTLTPQTETSPAEAERAAPPAAPRVAPPRPAPVAMSRADFDEPNNEFAYRPVPVTAPVALFLGVSAIIGLFGVLGLAVGVVGLVVGLISTLQIRRSNGELTGLWLAVSGLALSVVFLGSGSVLHAYTYATEVPEGFERVNFSHDISKKGFVVVDGETQIHPDVQNLDGQKIFLKGYMYPERQTSGLMSFVIVKDNQQCCFGGQPQPFDMITVTMDPGQTVEFVPTLVSVAGVFRAQAPQQSGSLKTVYKLEASYFSPSKTSF